MPKTVSVKDMPKPAHSTANLQPKPRKHPAILDFQEQLLKDPVRRESEVAVYTLDDGVTSRNHDSISGSLRSMAKKLGYKLTIIWQPNEGSLYVQVSGKYVPLSGEELAARRIRRVSNAELKRLRNRR